MSAKSRSTLATELTTAVNDNTSGDITPADMRGVITDANDSAVNKTDETTALSQSLLAQSTAAGMQSVVECPPTSRTISAGTGLTGGGDLSANRTLSVSFGTTSGTACQGNDSRLSDARTPTSHTHAQSEVTNLVTDLAAKAPLASPTFTGTPPIVPDDPYDGTDWNGNFEVPTKNAIRNKIESLAAAGDRYIILSIGAGSENPTDSQTVYWGTDLSGLAPLTTSTNAEVLVPLAGQVVAYHLYFRVNIGGSSETVNFYLRLNNTTDFGNATDTWDATYTYLSVTGLSQSVSAGDRLVVKNVYPAWATNPTGVRFSGYIVIKLT